MILKNLGINEFCNYIKQNNKRLIVFGAGQLTGHFLRVCHCTNNLIAVVDNNRMLQGTRIQIDNVTKEVISPEHLCDIITSFDKTEIALVIIPPRYSVEIFNQLKQYEELNGIEAFIFTFIRNTNESSLSWSFPLDYRRIPQVIHYIWIGKKEIPYRLQKCVDSWHEYNPEYQIKLWNEDNYDFLSIPFMKEAYENKEWGFATNVARLDIVYKYGGIYLDTDVELYRNIDCLLNTDAFFCMASSDRINTGVGFGGIAKHPLIKSMLDVYYHKSFIDEKGIKCKVSPFFEQHGILENWGLHLNNEFQVEDGVAIYPAEVLSPYGIMGCGNYKGQHTIGAHLDYGSWRSEDEKRSLVELRKLLVEEFTK
jgi:hypothetical protein